MNLHAKKSAYERGELATIVNDRVNKVEHQNTQNLKEINAFLNTVHADLEDFLVRHKKEHNTLNMRLLTMTQDATATLEQVRQAKRTIDRQATVLACLTEYSAIEHALTAQDEIDREDMQLMTSGKKNKDIMSPRSYPTIASSTQDQQSSGLKGKAFKIGSVKAFPAVHKNTNSVQTGMDEVTPLGTKEVGFMRQGALDLD